LAETVPLVIEILEKQHRGSFLKTPCRQLLVHVAVECVPPAGWFGAAVTAFVTST